MYWVASALGSNADLELVVERFSAAVVVAVTGELERREDERCTVCDFHHDDVDDGEHIAPGRLRERLRSMTVEMIYEAVKTVADAARLRASRSAEVVDVEAELSPSLLTSCVRMDDTTADGPGAGGCEGEDPGAVGDETGVTR